MIRRMKAFKLRSKMLLLILFTGSFSILLFQFLWNSQDAVWKVMSHVPPFAWDEEAYIRQLREEAVKYDIPSSEKDADAIEKLQTFLSMRDFYTGLHIYGLDDGLYRTGHGPDVVVDLIYGSILSSGYYLTMGEGEKELEVEMNFRNGSALVVIQSFHSARIVYPYFFFSLLLSIFIFLFVILNFINRKMKAVLSLKEEILLMASGDLEHPVPEYGKDEIGILSRELDKLRITLSDNIRQEKESRLANQDLITAMSHDLRTPLTILNGYLEILKLKRNPSAREEYLDRCLLKVADMKTLTDKMFEYALVYDASEDIDLHEVLIGSLFTCLLENMDFIRLAGFAVDSSPFPQENRKINGDETMLKRIFSNLFSNILKYGDKKIPVQVHVGMQEQSLSVSLENGIKPDKETIESNRIGLKSTEKMVLIHQGKLKLFTHSGTYGVQVNFPLLP